jgi:hypothetical protein
MNRVLSWPQTPLVPGLLDALKTGRHRTVVNEDGMVRFELPLGGIEMKFCDPQHQVPAGTVVDVWWKGGGLVCAPAAELDADEQAARVIAERFREIHQQLAAARREREVRLASMVHTVRPAGEPASPLLMTH